MTDTEASVCRANQPPTPGRYRLCFGKRRHGLSVRNLVVVLVHIDGSDLAVLVYISHAQA